MINIDDFLKLDIRVGEILSAEKVPETDKLLKLMVDVGEESPRQILSGISEYFPEPRVLVGKQTPFVINLETRIIRGLESQGMILAAENGEEFSLLSLDKKIKNGSRLK